MPSRVYKGIEVVQQTAAPPFYLTSVPAQQLLEWCDVPRAKGNYMAGYQRTLNDKRSSALTKYVNLSPLNIVPGAIIVAVDEDHVSLRDLGQGLKEFTVSDDTRTQQEKLIELFGAFSSRLSSEELSSAGITFSAEDWDDNNDDELEGEYPTSYVASLVKELQIAITDWDTLPPERQTAITDYIQGVSKPGLIIDGQHRVFGAARANQEIFLPVVLLPGLKYSEQVFQFYVLNSKAKPLIPTELRRIVSTSLTNEEIEQLYNRFKQAGVTAEEARWTLEMNTRSESPFRNRIDFGFSGAGEIIKENVADQVVRAFMLMPSRRYKLLTAPLGEQWTDPEQRLNIYFGFWKAIKAHYSTVWSEAEAAAEDGKQHNLFLKVTLLTLQKWLLDRFVTALAYRAGQPPPLSTDQEIQQMVSSTLQNLPAEFFTREWKLKQIDTSPGREELYKAMDAVWNNQGTIHGNMKLFRG
jgi:hypothetical protein